MLNSADLSVFDAITKAFNLLTKSEIRKLAFVALVQVLLAILDLVAVILIGLVASIAINGLSSQQIGNRTQSFVNLLNLGALDLKLQVAILGLIASTVLLIKTICSLYFTKKSLLFLARRAAAISSNLISMYLTQPLLFIRSYNSQQVIFMMTTGVSGVTLGIIGSIVYLISDIALLIVLLSGLFLVDPLISFATLIMFGSVTFILYRLMHKKMVKFGELQSKLTVTTAQQLSEVMESYKEIYVRGRREYYISKLSTYRYLLADSNAENSFYQNLSKYILDLAMVAIGLVLGALAFLTQTPTRAVAILSIFLIASVRIGPAVLRVQQVFLQIKASIGGSFETLKLLERLKKMEMVKPASNKSIESFTPMVSAKNISFTYPNKMTPTLLNINMEILPGSFVSIVGPSGAGKTTLVDILLGILEPDTGEVYISNCKPIEAVTLWPGLISYVPQDTAIINGSIKENVGLGFSESNIDINRVNESLELSELQKLVSSLPDGIETQVGEKGFKLSGGQRQRLGIARALYTNPRLIVLDEATSSLDGATESSISDSINSLRGKITLITIAHRLSTVRSSDEVFYLENGNIMAQGTFEQVKQKVPNFHHQAKLMGL